MHALVHLITGVEALDQINDRLLLMNNISLSFAILSSIEMMHELIDQIFLSIYATIQRS